MTALRYLPICLMVCGLAVSTNPSWANDAEIVALIGKGDARNTAQEEWHPASIKQKVKAGGFVRTGESSQMALLLADQTQVRLNQQSLLQIKGVIPTSESTRLSLERGRAWSQAKQGEPPIKTASVSVTTPAGTATIRGTDWELTVDDKGETTLVVLSGAVDFANEAGGVNVGPNEQAVATPGKAPVKRTLSDAPDRVQWVTSWRPSPQRWLPQPKGDFVALVGLIEKGDYAQAMSQVAPLAPRNPEAAVLLADLYLFLGRWNDAVQVLSQHADHPQAAALSARVRLQQGQIAEAGRIVAQARAKYPDHVELLLAEAEIARLNGNGIEALRSFSRVLALEPKLAEAWFGVGRIETERENVAPARSALSMARQIAPRSDGYAAEAGTLETFANNFSAARTAFDEGLAAHPDDYQAWTGLGILLLKTGHPEQAREAFLKAGVIEPRYARVQMYLGIAYYQLGNKQRALESLRKAAELDPRDPVPHMMISLIQGDALELGNAIQSAQAAQERMPYLRSLNQVLNNQKGSANVGSSLSAFGMEEWARAYAVDSMNPYWAGSHLFLADRYDGLFNKNSELFKGFLTDPTVFGASNRASSLVAVPGHYGSASIAANDGDFHQQSLQGALNGYSTTNVPFAYSVVAERMWGETSNDTFGADGHNLTIGLGMRPSSELGFFLFANDSNISGRFTDVAGGLPNNPVGQDYSRHDLGLSYRYAHDNQIWLKIGGGSQQAKLKGPFIDPVLGLGTIEDWRGETDDGDFAFRQTFDLNKQMKLTWGIEAARSRIDTTLYATFPILPPFPDLELKQTTRSRDVYISANYQISQPLRIQADLFNQNFDYHLTQKVPAPAAIVDDRDYSEWNPRLGARLTLGNGQTLRMAYQQWRRPASASTLSQIDTAGIALDDQLPAAGGKLNRARLQYEREIGKRMFLQAYVDHESVRNINTPDLSPMALLTNLDSLRTNRQAFGKVIPYLERTPDFGRGKVTSLGISGNLLLRDDISIAMRYVQADSENTGSGMNGLHIPFIPRHYLGLGLFTQPFARTIVGIQSTYRSKRYQDEANTQELKAGWNLGIRGYWESLDKRWLIDAALENVNSEKQATIDRQHVFRFSAAYRF